jgi:hypothetical protein
MRRLLAVLVMLALSLFVAACGDDDDDDDSGESAAAVASFKFSGSEMTGPSSVEAGAVRVDFANSADEDAGVTIVRVEGDHTADEAVKAGKAWGDGGKPLPEWLTFEGGSSSVAPGKDFSAVQELTEGTYLGLDINSNEYVEFDVTGDGAGELPSTTATIDAVDYSFEASGLEAGTQPVLFSNTGKEPHFALAAPIKPGKTIEDVKKSLRSESGPSPIIEDETVATGVLDGGREQVVDLELRKGAYALVCFVPDRAGGPPHAFKGMVSEAVVE